jgi:3-(3-hydroxy-phenyl)propionate hydroxylase
VQRQTIENKKNIEQKDPVARQAFYDELRAIVADPAKLRPYLVRVAMIEGIARSNSIT